MLRATCLACPDRFLPNCNGLATGFEQSNTNMYTAFTQVRVKNMANRHSKLEMQFSQSLYEGYLMPCPLPNHRISLVTMENVSPR